MSPRLGPLSWIIGTWESVEASGQFPTIQDFQYKETLEFRPVGLQPLLIYSGKSSHPEKGNPMHNESGYLRIRGDKELSFMVAHNFGKLYSCHEALKTLYWKFEGENECV